MASVSVVSSTDFRTNLSQPQNNAPGGDDPFSLLLNAVTDVKADVGAQDAPKGAERRDDVPAKQPKPEADADRQAKKQTKDTEQPEAKPQAESTAAPTPVKDDGEDEETDVEDGGADAAAVDALLIVALNDTQQQTQIPVQLSADAAAAVPAAAAVTTNTQMIAETQTAPSLAAAIADVTAAASVEMQPAQTAPNTAQTKAQFEIAAAPANAEVEALTAAPKVAAETISSLLKPLEANAKIEGQLQTQPGPVNVATAVRLDGPAPLEMLNAAINKHIQLSLGADAGEQPDAQKPLLSSNAVAPNFAMTAQVNAPVQVQTQAVAEASRAVPLDQLAVEIATRANKGERRFDIRLDPPELGRIDVRLEIDSKGNTTTKLIVERAETLDMLQRDARGLEKALQNAGLKTDAGGMQFSLQQDTQAQHGHRSHAPEMRAQPDLVQADGEVMAEVSINSATLAAQLRGGVDIRI